MANYCFTKYAIEGRKEALTRIKDAINKVQKESEERKNYDLHLKEVLVELGIYPNIEALKKATNNWTECTPEGLGIAGNWLDAKLENMNGQIVLRFTEEYKWDCSYDMEIISNMPSFADAITGVYRRSEEGGSGMFETNDKDGKYFPERYHVFDEEDYDDVYFLTQEEALAHIRKQYKLSDEFDTIDKIKAYCYENDLCCCFDEIVVI